MLHYSTRCPTKWALHMHTFTVKSECLWFACFVTVGRVKLSYGGVYCVLCIVWLSFSGNACRVFLCLYGNELAEGLCKVAANYARSCETNPPPLF